MTLLLEIAHCPEAAHCFTHPTAEHPCQKIIQVQGAGSLAELQVPEPWSGDLEHAPILFLSSNPSISTAEIYPRWAWPDEEIAGFFGRRFGGGRVGDYRESRKEGKVRKLTRMRRIHGLLRVLVELFIEFGAGEGQRIGSG